MNAMNKASSLVAGYLFFTLVQRVDALVCYNCSEHMESCTDEHFLDYPQTSVKCSQGGTCMKVKLTSTGQVARFCEWGVIDLGCQSDRGFIECACKQDNCNGPVVGTEGGLQCYDCNLIPKCKDDVFSDHEQDIVNCRNGSCITTTYLKSGQVHRHCSSQRLPEGCANQTYDGEEAITCACHDRNGCNDADADDNVASIIHQPILAYICAFILFCFA